MTARRNRVRLALVVGSIGLAAASLQPARAARATLASTLPQSVSTGQARLAGALAPDQVMEFSISLPLRDPAGLASLLAGLADPASPNFRRYLSVSQFTDRFGPTQADYEQAKTFLAAQGLTVTRTWPNRQLIDVSGRVADIERVLHVHMGLYRSPNGSRVFYSADRLPTLDLGVAINQVVGLDDETLPYSRLLRSDRSGRAAPPLTGSGPDGNLDGDDMRNAYGAGSTLTGAGQSIGLMELQGLNLPDVALFFAKGYGPANHVPIKLIKAGHAPVTCSGTCTDDSEQALDVEYAISMAPALSSVRVYVANSPEVVLNAMASDDASNVLSTSWGWGLNAEATDNNIFMEFAAQGQTNLTASGDSPTLKASLPWPEESAWIISVGGTTLSMTGPGGTWASETGWSDSASGPALDHSITIPYWQRPYINAANRGSTKYRNVSDIAASADFNMTLCADGTCAGGAAGTSFASPIWAGFIALVDQYASLERTAGVGFFAPYMYQVIGHSPAYPYLFHDIVTGQSGLYSCTTGYDLVTGLGSPAGEPLIQAFVPTL